MHGPDVEHFWLFSIIMIMIVIAVKNCGTLMTDHTDETTCVMVKYFHVSNNTGDFYSIH